MSHIDSIAGWHCRSCGGRGPFTAGKCDACGSMEAYQLAEDGRLRAGRGIMPVYECDGCKDQIATLTAERDAALYGGPSAAGKLAWDVRHAEIVAELTEARDAIASLHREQERVMRERNEANAQLAALREAATRYLYLADADPEETVTEQDLAEHRDALKTAIDRSEKR